MSTPREKELIDKAFGIHLILSNIFLHVMLEKNVLTCALVNRWWNRVATERLWYKFRVLANDPEKRSFEKFFKVLSAKNCIHDYGHYVRILDMEKWKYDHKMLLNTLKYCPRLESLLLRSITLNATEFNEIAELMPEWKIFKLNDVTILEGRSLMGLANHCHKLEDLFLKTDIQCDGEVLVEIVKKCRRLRRLSMEQKPYEDDIMGKVLEHCSDLIELKMDQCINTSDEFLPKIYSDYCSRLKKISVHNTYEIKTDFVIATARYFRNATKLGIQKVDKPLESKLDASDEKIDCCLYEFDLGDIFDFFKNRPKKLTFLSLTGITFSGLTFEIICEGLSDLTFLNLDRIDGLKKVDILRVIPKLKNLELLYVRFQTYTVDPLTDQERYEVAAACPSLEHIQWHRLKYDFK